MRASFCALLASLACCVIEPDEPRVIHAAEPVATWVSDPVESLRRSGQATLQTSDWILPGDDLGRALQIRAGGATLRASATWSVTRRQVTFVLREPPPAGLQFELRVDSTRLPTLSGLPLEVPPSDTLTFDPTATWAPPAASVTPSFDTVAALLAPCAACHGTPTAPALTHAWLLAPSTHDPRLLRVDARRPWASRLLHLVIPGYPVDPTPMPPPWAHAAALDTDAIEQIEAWIAAGAAGG